MPNMNVVVWTSSSSFGTRLSLDSSWIENCHRTIMDTTGGVLTICLMPYWYKIHYICTETLFVTPVDTLQIYIYLYIEAMIRFYGEFQHLMYTFSLLSYPIRQIQIWYKSTLEKSAGAIKNGQHWAHHTQDGRRQLGPP